MRKLFFLLFFLLLLPCVLSLIIDPDSVVIGSSGGAFSGGNYAGQIVIGVPIAGEMSSASFNLGLGWIYTIDFEVPEFDFDVSWGPDGVSTFRNRGRPNATNYIPQGQRPDIGIFLVEEIGTGSVDGNVWMDLSQDLTHITVKCSDNNVSGDALDINSSSRAMVMNLNADSNHYIWCWADYGWSPQGGNINFQFHLIPEG